jgi:hypothetical protein
LDDFSERIAKPMMNNLAGNVQQKIMSDNSEAFCNMTANLDNTAAGERIGVGHERPFAGGRVGVDISVMRARLGLRNDTVLRLSWSRVLGDGMAIGGSSSASRGGLGATGAPLSMPSLLDDTLRRPTVLPRQVLARLDGTANRSRLVMIDKSGLPAGSTDKPVLPHGWACHRNVEAGYYLLCRPTAHGYGHVLHKEHTTECDGGRLVSVFIGTGYLDGVTVILDEDVPDRSAYVTTHVHGVRVQLEGRHAYVSDDVENAARFYQRALELGYTSERFQSSLRAQDPLSSLPKKLRDDFERSLEPYQRQMLNRAMQYYGRLAAAKHQEKTLFPRQPNPQFSPRYDRLQEIISGRQNLSDAAAQRAAEKLVRESLQPARR